MSIGCGGLAGLLGAKQTHWGGRRGVADCLGMPLVIYLWEFDGLGMLVVPDLWECGKTSIYITLGEAHQYAQVCASTDSEKGRFLHGFWNEHARLVSAC